MHIHVLRARTLGLIAACPVLAAPPWPMVAAACHQNGPKFRAECGSCHGVSTCALARELLAAPAGQSAAAFRYRCFAGRRHAGAQVRSFIQDNAGSYRRVREAPPQDRITRSDWFLRSTARARSPPKCGSVPASRARPTVPPAIVAQHRRVRRTRGADSALTLGDHHAIH